MATGPDHYREAELLLAAANRRMAGDDSKWLNTPERRAELRAEADVRATLALAAATAILPGITGMFPLADYKAWAEVAAVKTDDEEPQS